MVKASFGVGAQAPTERITTPMLALLRPPSAGSPPRGQCQEIGEVICMLPLGHFRVQQHRSFSKVFVSCSGEPKFGKVLV